MKAVIWILVFLVGTVVNTIIGYAIGIRAGAILLYAVEYYIAKKLCEKWDKHKNEKEAFTIESSPEQGLPNVNTPIGQEESGQVEIVNEQAASALEESPTYKTISYCRYCGFKLVEGSNFCNNCGTKIERGSEV